MNIAFCINRLALIGLGPTVSSLINNCSNSSELSLYFLCANLRNLDKDNIKLLLENENFKGEFHYLDFNPAAEFGRFRSLHGDWTAYGRLLLPELLYNEESVLYLDSDLIVEIDVLSIKDFDFKNKALAAVNRSRLKYALDNPFLNGKLSIPLESDYFNSGVLYFNLIEWRLKNLKEKCMQIGRKYPMEILSHDQTLLNAVFSNDYEKLPIEFNCSWYAHKRRPEVAGKMILHFVGSPKPWDLFGRLLHNGYSTWIVHLDGMWSKTYKRKEIKDLIRLWHIRRSYLRTIKNKLFNAIML